MNLDELLTIDPDVTPIEDARVRFYLDNQRLIDTWARLKDEAAAALQERLLDLVPTLSEDADQLGLTDVEIAPADVDKGTPRVQVVRSSWVDDSGASPVAVVIEWNRALINRRGDLELFAGLRSKLSHPRSDTLLDPLANLGAELRAALGKGWQGKRGRYPLWRWVRTDSDQLDEIALIRLARREFWHCWQVAAPRLDALLMGSPTGGGVRPQGAES